MIDTAPLRALLAETTQGEWRVNEEWSDDVVDIVAEFDMPPYGKEWGILFDPRPTTPKADYEFIAAAHNTMPALLDELDAARSEILTLRARLGNIADLTTMPLPPDWTKHNM